MNKITARALAKKAGVSTGTVSRILNNIPGHSPETVARVRAAMYELGFTAPPSKSEASKTSLRQVAMLFPDQESAPLGMVTPLGVGLARGADEVLARNRQQLLVTQMRQANELPLCITGRQVDGIMVREGTVPEALLEILYTLPGVWVYGTRRGAARIDLVTPDNFQTGQLAAELLRTGNASKFIIVTHNRRFYSEFHIRTFSCRLGLENAGLNVESIPIESLLQHIEKLANEPFSAFIPGHDEDVIAAARLLETSKHFRRGRSKLVAVITDVELVTREFPWIQAITISPEEVGHIAAQQLLWRIQNPHELIRTVLVPPKIVSTHANP